MGSPFPVASRSRATAIALIRFLSVFCLFLTSGIFPAADAGELSKADIERRFQPPLHVQEKLSQIPAWPLTSELEPEGGPVGYVFESIDLAPVPGFEGTPMNFLVSIDRKGNFLNVELLRQHEPVFLGGLGEAPLREFVTQYAGRNLKQQFLIALNAARNRSGPADSRSDQTTLDGVAKATASVRIVNQTVLGAALEVARAKLGFADRSQRGPAAQVRPEIDAPLTFAEMLNNGMVGHLRLSNAEVEKLFAGTDGAGIDEEGLAQPEAVFADIYIAYLNTPSIGRAILGEAQYQAAMARNFENRHLWWIGSAGRYPIVDDNFVPGGQSSRLRMAQDGLFLELRDQGFDPTAIAGPLELNTSRLFGVYAEAGLDPGRPLELSLTITRAKGMILPTLTHQTVSLSYAPPARLFIYPPAPLPEWLLAWQQRGLDLAILSAALILLSVVLTRPRWISIDARRLKIFRLGFLSFTLLYVGWYAQGQLSIVQVTGALKALKAGQGLASFLYDPISLLLIAFTLFSFVIWGRGTFCGWLCPFGALQEFVGWLARRLHVPRLHIPLALAKRLEGGRYLVLAVLVGAALFLPRQGESLNEIEPFKTAITVGFDRNWPFVAYAAGLLLVGAFYYKFFCRFICPLGGVMSLGGRLRRFDWLPRRAECGKPCQSCKAKCAYDAIEPSGEIRYDACFQCLDCVGIYHDAQRCTPILLYEKKGMVLTPKGVMRGAAGD
ncbi:4Fe-4S binding protein [Dechloromonas sp. A34]|uniref:4Fe-4S binding protein n=1 Tax=Dechloromonas sp. A34 TaxID=447588 RepID=UPI0022496304|nr:4Fe-4S binding protein [Dechloromonas sp. A34]